MTDNLNLPPNSNSGFSRKSSELKKFIELPPEHKCEDSEKLIMRVLDGIPNPSVNGKELSYIMDYGDVDALFVGKIETWDQIKDENHSGH